MVETVFNVKIPKVGKQYKFYDDGKIRQGRRCTATVLRILSVEDAKSLMFPIYVYEESGWIPTTIAAINEEPIGETSLYTVWKENVEEYHWVFATETDCFIECSIPKYDDYPIWFARMKNGNWFSLNIQSTWQGGLLDIDNHLTEELEEWMKE